MTALKRHAFSATFLRPLCCKTLCSLPGGNQFLDLLHLSLDMTGILYTVCSSSSGTWPLQQLGLFHVCGLAELHPPFPQQHVVVYLNQNHKTGYIGIIHWVKLMFKTIRGG